MFDWFQFIFLSNKYGYIGRLFMLHIGFKKNENIFGKYKEYIYKYAHIYNVYREKNYFYLYDTI